MTQHLHRWSALLVAAAVTLAACGGGSDSASTTSTTTADSTTSSTADSTTSTTAAPATLTILVTNDDGIGAPGIDSVAKALSALDDVEIIVVAPAENQSGSSDSTTDGELTAASATTSSGIEGTAVDGFPADSVNYALDELGIEPDLVVSGVNSGQNVGPLAAISGTVGAARTAIRRGIPAVAASAGLSEETDFDAASALVTDWVEEHRADLVAGTVSTDTLVSFNIPDCTAGEIGALVEVPRATEIPDGLNVFVTDCSTRDDTAAEPVDDIDAISKGFAAETLVPAEL